jgi:hypothetical protein
MNMLLSRNIPLIRRDNIMNKEHLNPFSNSNNQSGRYAGSYCEFAIEQTKHLGVGDTMIIDLAYGNHSNLSNEGKQKKLKRAKTHFRNALRSIGWKVSILSDIEGNQWIKRIE